MEAFLQLNQITLSSVTGNTLQLLAMFEPDDEMKGYVIDKKEQQRVEDEYEKLDKAVD